MTCFSHPLARFLKVFTSSFTPTPRSNISISMPSKGLDVYSYISPDPRADLYTIKFEVPGKYFINTKADNFSVKPLEVAIAKSRSFIGRFQWTALRNGKEVANGWNDVNALTGNLERGTMLDTKHILPVILPDVIIICGFYDAGTGKCSQKPCHEHLESCVAA